MATESDDPPGVQCGVDGVQEGFKTQPGIARHGHLRASQGNGTELQEQSGAGHIFMAIGWAHIIEQGHAEAALWIGQAHRQAAVAITSFSLFVIRCIGASRVVGAVYGLIGAGVNDIAGFLIARGRLAADLRTGRAVALASPPLFIFCYEIPRGD